MWYAIALIFYYKPIELIYIMMFIYYFIMEFRVDEKGCMGHIAYSHSLIRNSSI